MPTYTTNYSFEQPIVGGDVNLWGGKINTVFGQIDTEIKNRANDISTVSTSVTTLSNATVKLDGSVAMTGMLRLPSGTNPTLSNHAVPLAYLTSVTDLLAPKASPAFTGTPTAPTATAGTNTTQLATTAFVTGALGSYLTSSTAASTYAPLASPALTGTPTAPTAASTTNTTQIATTAFVNTAITNARDAMSVKTADQTVTSSTAYVLAFSGTIPAGRRFEITAVLTINCAATSGIKIGVGTDNATQSGSYIIYPGVLPFAPPVTTTTPTTVFSTTTAQTNVQLVIRATIVANAAANTTLTFYMAQQASGTTASIVRAGSYIKLTGTV